MDKGKFNLEMRMISIIQKIDADSFYKFYYGHKMPVYQIWDKVVSPFEIFLPDCVHWLSADYNN